MEPQQDGTVEPGAAGQTRAGADPLALSLGLSVLDLVLTLALGAWPLPAVAARTANLLLVLDRLGARLLGPGPRFEARAVTLLLLLFTATNAILRLEEALGCLSPGASALLVALGAPLALRALAGRPGFRPGHRPLEPMVAAAYAAAGLALLRAQATQWGAAPIGWDGLVYHLDWVAQFRAQGDLATAISPYGTSSVPFLPRGPAVYWLWFLHADPGLDALASHLELPFAAGLFLLVTLIGERLGASRPVAAWTGALLTLSPTLRAMSPTIGNDMTQAFGAVVSTWAVSRWRDQPGRGAGVLAGLAVGLMLEAKFVGVLFLPLLVLVALPPPRRWRGLGVMVAVAALVIAPDYGRNLAATGNPLFPARIDLGFTTLPGTFGTYDDQAGSEDLSLDLESVSELLGSAWVPLLAGALAAPLLASGLAARLSSLAGPAAFFLVLWFSPYQYRRYVFACAPLVAAAAAATGTRLLSGRRAPGQLVLVGLLVLLAFPAQQTLHRAHRQRLRTWHGYPPYQEAARAWAMVDARVPADARLLVIEDVQAYTYRGSRGTRTILRPRLAPDSPARIGSFTGPGFLPAYRRSWSWGRSPTREEMAEAIRTADADWVVHALAPSLAPQPDEEARLPWELEGHQLIASSRRFRLFRRTPREGETPPAPAGTSPRPLPGPVHRQVVDPSRLLGLGEDERF